MISSLFTTKYSNIIVILQSFVLLYIFILEPDACQCERDWKHSYIKVFSIFIILYHIFRISVELDFEYNKKYFVIMWLSLSLLYIINAYAVYTYVNTLKETKCKCAIQHYELNKFMFYFKFILIAIAIGSFSISVKLFNDTYHLFV